VELFVDAVSIKAVFPSTKEHKVLRGLDVTVRFHCVLAAAASHVQPAVLHVSSAGLLLHIWS
jgi:hypothetical protein